MAPIGPGLAWQPAAGARRWDACHTAVVCTRWLQRPTCRGCRLLDCPRWPRRAPGDRGGEVDARMWPRGCAGSLAGGVVGRYSHPVTTRVGSGLVDARVWPRGALGAWRVAWVAVIATR